MVEVRRLINGVELTHQQLRLRVEAWGKDSLRVRASMMQINDDMNWALLEPEKIKPIIELKDHEITIGNGGIVGQIKLSPDKVSNQPWSITFLRSTGEELLSEDHHRFKRWRGIYLKPKGGNSFT